MLVLFGRGGLGLPVNGVAEILNLRAPHDFGVQGLEIGGLGQGEHGPLIRADSQLQPLRGVDAGPALTHAHALGVFERADHKVEDELGVL